ncbi:MAG: TSUP family transporter [Oscillospiraceae bacterium]|nr:TSUP family transporter [Oscillospiraceae bacterium]
MEYLHTLIYLAPLVFLAGFIDSAVGGGGTISIPAYLLTGMPAHMAFGTNKLSACLGTAIAAGRFIKNKAIDLRTAVISAVGALIGAALGSQFVLLLDDRTLRLMLIVALPCVAVFLIFRKDKVFEAGHEGFSRRKTIVLASAIGFAIGLYDGIIGPGTGTFAIIAYNAVMRYDLKTASGNAKVLNLASNFASLVTFAIAGHVLFAVGLPAALFGIAGNYLGAGFAIKKGAKFLRPMLFVVLGLLLLRVVYDFVLNSV